MGKGQDIARQQSTSGKISGIYVTFTPHHRVDQIMVGNAHLAPTCFMHLRVGQASPAIIKCWTGTTSHFAFYRLFNFMCGQYSPLPADNSPLFHPFHIRTNYPHKPKYMVDNVHPTSLRLLQSFLLRNDNFLFAFTKFLPIDGGGSGGGERKRMPTLPLSLPSRERLFEF